MLRSVLRVILSGIVLCFFWPDSAGVEPRLSFSHERGYYNSSFELTLTVNTDGCVIAYTLDGSDPKTSENARICSSPATISVSPFNREGRAITPGFVVRACAICNNDTGNVETHTYIFPSEVKFQSDISADLVPYWPDQSFEPCTYPPNLLDWMRADYQHMDLGIDPEVVAKDEYYSSFERVMTDMGVPTLSLVTDPSNFFDPVTGIYINSVWSGIEWERSGSIELINSFGTGFQSNTGIRIRGGWSSSGNFAKHAFRLFFRKEYGNGKLNYPLFDDEGVDEFDKIDLRCDQNNSWHVPGGNSNADFIHDLFARDLQGDMQQPYTRSRYYHLYVNGMYWGLYETQERPEANYAASYFGGNKEEYDVIKSSGPSYDWEPYTLEATDGNLDAASILWEIAKQGFSHENYFKALGLNPDGTKNTDYPILLDDDNLIDYMIIIYFAANRDGPGELNGGIRINNFFGIYNRERPDGFKFFVHDAETAFANVNDNITNSPTIAGEDFERFNPAWLHQKLMENRDYRQKFADRAWHHLFNKGALTADKNSERFMFRAGEIDQAIIGESARWGDVYGSTIIPYTKIDTWLPVVAKFQENYFPKRTDIVINQFKNMGWLNDLHPPELDSGDFIFNDAGIQISKGSMFDLINPNDKGEIYYTLNESDPRVSGGGISDDAILFEHEIMALQTVFIKARIKAGDEWSPLVEHVISVNTGTDLKISEISYNPQQQVIGVDTLASKDLEFIELKNCHTDTIDISGYAFTRGIRYEFPRNSLMPPGSFMVIASDTACFRRLYGFAPHGQYEGNLKNDAEEIYLESASGTQLIHFTYNFDKVWYDATDGSGFTLALSGYRNPQSYALKSDWRISTNWLGSPGGDDPPPSADTLVITEVLANSEAPLTDAIELYNPTYSDVNIGNGYLSDDKDDPAKWRIPGGTVVPSKGYTVFHEGHYLNDTLRFDTNEFGQAFSISSAGESVYVFSADNEGRILNFICEYKVGATTINTSFGNYLNTMGEGKQALLDTLYLGANNENFLKSPVIFKTIMYHPTNENVEYIVLKNRTDSVVNLFSEHDSLVTWKIDGIRFLFPGRVSLDAGDSLYLVEKELAVSVFRNIRSIDPDVRVFNYEGQLRNNTETISVQEPIYYKNDTGLSYAYVTLESVAYKDESPWPSEADGRGYALQRKDEEAFADNALNWTTRYDRIPNADAGSDKRVKVNAQALLDGSGSYDPDGQILSYKWELISKPGGSSLAPPDHVCNPGITPDMEGKYTYLLEVDNGAKRSIPSYVSIYAYENRPPVALTRRPNYRTPVNTGILIDARRSYDPDYDEISYQWEILNRPDGSTVELNSYDTDTLLFTPDVVGRYDVKLTVNDGFLNSNPYVVAVTALTATGITGNAFTSEMRIYPNPTRDDVRIEFMLHNSTAAILSLTDINGHRVYNHNIAATGTGLQQFILHLGELHLTEGVYFIQIQSEEFIKTEKIVFIR
ncbi:MAG: lamin tail domain-containing protein [Bacteroidales bacterium]|nr:lamin tail domain-containing protein [Bacteroidales bacterium]